MNARAIHLGVRGWDHDSWRGRFYPDDLPEDWRLAYYANEFSCVWLDFDAWRMVSKVRIQALRAEVGADFIWLLEAPREVEEGLALVEDKALAIINPTDQRIIWFDADTDLAELAKRVSGARDAGSRYVMSRDADLARIEEVRTLLDLLGH
jgi:uncharacterized protein YecE (DUF72 family)